MTRNAVEAGTPEPQTKTGKLLLMSGLSFGSGRRLADSPELIAAIEAEARAAERERLAARVRAMMTVSGRDVLLPLRPETLLGLLSHD